MESQGQQIIQISSVHLVLLSAVNVNAKNKLLANLTQTLLIIVNVSNTRNKINSCLQCQQACRSQSFVYNWTCLLYKCQSCVKISLHLSLHHQNMIINIVSSMTVTFQGRSITKPTPLFVWYNYKLAQTLYYFHSGRECAHKCNSLTNQPLKAIQLQLVS